MSKILAIILLVAPMLYGFPAEKSENLKLVSPGVPEVLKNPENHPPTSEVIKKPEKNPGNPPNYVAERNGNSSMDKITEAIGTSQEVEVIEGDYSRNKTKIRTARHGHGGSHSSSDHFHSSSGGSHSYSSDHSHYGGWHHHSYSSYSPSYYSSSSYTPSYDYSSSYTPSYYGSYGYGYSNTGYSNNYYGYGNSNYYLFYILKE
ncbi:unnamed protein product [Caenorhabditis brenneri]